MPPSRGWRLERTKPVVIMGMGLGVKAVEAMGLASTVIFRGLAAIIEAYLIYWAVVYFVARRFFGFSKEWAAPLASGISICGVSAAIATGGTIRARPIVPIMVSSLVVIFAVVELVALPFAAQTFLYREPMVAGAWMGLAVKTDGAAMASGAIVESLIRAKGLAELGVEWKEGWILMTTTTVKVFIGVWAFILAIIWCTVIERREGERISPKEIWQRFPKFVLGYAGTFLLTLCVCLALPPTRQEEQARCWRVCTCNPGAERCWRVRGWLSQAPPSCPLAPWTRRTDGLPSIDDASRTAAQRHASQRSAPWRAETKDSAACQVTSGGSPTASASTTSTASRSGAAVRTEARRAAPGLCVCCVQTTLGQAIPPSGTRYPLVPMQRRSHGRRRHR